jgi:hypothetical protein
VGYPQSWRRYRAYGLEAEVTWCHRPPLAERKSSGRRAQADVQSVVMAACEVKTCRQLLAGSPLVKVAVFTECEILGREKLLRMDDVIVALVLR